VTDRVIAEVAAARERGSTTPINVCWVGPHEAEANRRRLLEAGIPCSPWAARTARTLAAARAPVVRPIPVVGEPLPPPASTDADGWLAPDETLRLVAGAGVPVVPWRLVDPGAAVVGAAGELGYPVVLKAVRPDLLHKTEAGAVRLSLADARAVRDAARDLERNLGPGPFLVQHQAEPGVELVIGAVAAPGFGTMVLAGLGGIWVEALGDVAMRLAPFGPDEAASMLDELRGASLLDGGRGRPPIDRARLACLIAEVSGFVARAPWLTELDINPLIATRDGDLVAVDARIRVATPD